MLLLLRLLLFASVFFSLAFGDLNVNDAAEEFYRVVIHEPVVEHHYLYHLEFCFFPEPKYSHDCWVTDMQFGIQKKVEDYYIT